MKLRGRVSCGALALVMTFLVGTFVVHEAPREMYSGFPVDLFVLLTGVTYLFGVAVAAISAVLGLITAMVH